MEGYFCKNSCCVKKPGVRADEAILLIRSMGRRLYKRTYCGPLGAHALVTQRSVAAISNTTITSQVLLGLLERLLQLARLGGV